MLKILRTAYKWRRPAAVWKAAVSLRECAGPIAYLSSPSLLNLQLQDVTFRRHQLVQIAMLLHFAVTSRENAALQVCFFHTAS